MSSGTSPVSPRPIRPPVTFKFILPTCAYHHSFRRVCPRLWCCTGQISPPESGCPQQPPALHPGFQTRPFWGRTLDRNCFCKSMLFWSPAPLLPCSPAPLAIFSSINGSHQVASYSLYTCLRMHSATWIITWQRHSFGLFAPSRTSWEQTACEQFLIPSTILLPLIRLVGIRIWRATFLSLSGPWGQILRMRT